MPNAAAHKLGAALAVPTAFAGHQHKTRGEIDWKPIGAAWLAGELGSLPDLLEPAIHPNHRGIFHSVTCLAGVGYGGYRLYQWEPEDDFGKLVRAIGMIACGAIGVHLLMDATTKKSLPLI
jgi:inner membrane protein